MNTQLYCDPGHALLKWRAHLPPAIGLEDLAVTTHGFAPSSHLVREMVGMERSHLGGMGGPLGPTSKNGPST